MPEASHSVEINRPAADVFAFLGDGENDPQWRSGVLDVRRRSGHGQGAVYEQGVKGPMGRRVPADYEITAYEPDRRIAFRAIAGPAATNIPGLRCDGVIRPASGAPPSGTWLRLP